MSRCRGAPELKAVRAADGAQRTLAAMHCAVWQPCSNRYTEALATGWLPCRWVGDATAVQARAKTVVRVREDQQTGDLRTVHIPDHVDIVVSCRPVGSIPVSSACQSWLVSRCTSVVELFVKCHPCCGVSCVLGLLCRLRWPSAHKLTLLSAQ